MYLTLHDSEMENYYVILFGNDGLGKVVGIFNDSYHEVKEMIKIDPYIKRMAEIFNVK